MKRLLLTGVLLAATIACDDKPASGPAASATTTSQAPSSPLQSAVRDGAIAAGFFDVKRMRDAGWFAAIDALPDAELKGPLEQLKKKCGTDPFAAVDQIAWSAGKKNELLAVAKIAVPPETALGCVRGLSGRAEEAKLGDRSVLRIGPVVVLVHDGHLVAGSEEWVKELLDGKQAGGGELAAKAAPIEGALVRVAAQPGEQIDRFSGSLVSSPTKLSFDAEVTAKDEATATKLAEQLDAMQKELAPVAAGQGITLPKITFERSGAALRGGFGIEGGPTQQVAFVGMASALAIYGVRQYLASAKSSEAKNALGAISRALMASVERETESGQSPRRFPASAPAVPGEVPRGRKYQSLPDDWQHASWKAIRFEMTMPQYYSYSFETSPDGKKCQVIARGDLDGDGVESKFTMDLTIDDGGQARRSGTIGIENELE